MGIGIGDGMVLERIMGCTRTALLLLFTPTCATAPARYFYVYPASYGLNYGVIFYVLCGYFYFSFPGLTWGYGGDPVVYSVLWGFFWERRGLMRGVRCIFFDA